jgi:hypothetical protein
MCSHCTIDQKEFSLEKRDGAYNDQDEQEYFVCKCTVWWFSHHYDLVDGKQSH